MYGYLGNSEEILSPTIQIRVLLRNFKALQSAKPSFLKPKPRTATSSTQVETDSKDMQSSGGSLTWGLSIHAVDDDLDGGVDADDGANADTDDDHDDDDYDDDDAEGQARES